MWNQSISEKLAKILQLIAHQPNRRPHPNESYVDIFDGGLVRVMTGVTEYEFTDGTRAFYGTGLDVTLTIYLPSGEEITIESTHSFCTKCGNHFSPTAKFCNQCGREL